MQLRNLLLLAAAAAALSAPASAALVGGLSTADFSSPIVERFTGEEEFTPYYNFGNGMVYTTLRAELDIVNFRGDGWGMGDDPEIPGGRSGTGDGYFVTYSLPATFAFDFANGINRFGFYGAEFNFNDDNPQTNGQLELEFYDDSGALIGEEVVNTAGIFAWDQFHGFDSGTALIHRVVFRNTGYIALDDIHFENAQVPEPAALGLLGLGLAGLTAARRRKAA